MSEQEGARDKVRRVFSRGGGYCQSCSQGKEKEPDSAKFSDYFDFSEPCASVLLIVCWLCAGEAEGILRVSIAPGR